MVGIGDRCQKLEFQSYIGNRHFRFGTRQGDLQSGDLLQDMLPEMAEGGKPGVAAIKHAHELYTWEARADDLDAKAIQKVESDLVELRATMFRRQAQEAFEIAQKAKTKILADGFDSSASAVSAYFKAAELERISKGAAELILRINKMTPEELIERASKLIKRKNEAIDAVVTEIDPTEVGYADSSG